MLLVLASIVAYVCLVIQFLFHGFRIRDFWTTVIILIVLFVVLMLWGVHRLTTPTKRQRQAAANKAASMAAARNAASKAAASGTAAPAPPAPIEFRVAGVTFDNDDGSSRQDILRHLKFGDPPYADDPNDLQVTIEEAPYNGELALAVYVNDYQVGYVPKNLIQKVKSARQSVATCYVSDVKITGGGTASDGRELSYGCSITLEY